MRAKRFHIFILTLITLNVLVVILETVDEIADDYYISFSILNIFQFNFHLRIHVANLVLQCKQKIFWSYNWQNEIIFSPMSLIDSL